MADEYVVTMKPGALPELVKIPSKAIELDQLQGWVGGYIEQVRLEPSGKLRLWFDEEGKMKKLDPCMVSVAGLIVGPVVVTSARGPADRGMPLETAQRVAELLLRFRVVRYKPEEDPDLN
jgi:preprotein translocase subunit Sec61beta